MWWVCHCVQWVWVCHAAGVGVGVGVGVDVGVGVWGGVELLQASCDIFEHRHGLG